MKNDSKIFNLALNVSFLPNSFGGKRAFSFHRLVKTQSFVLSGLTPKPQRIWVDHQLALLLYMHFIHDAVRIKRLPAHIWVRNCFTTASVFYVGKLYRTNIEPAKNFYLSFLWFLWTYFIYTVHFIIYWNSIIFEASFYLGFIYLYKHMNIVQSV